MKAIAMPDPSARQKRLVATIYANSLMGIRSTVNVLLEWLPADEEYVKEVCGVLLRNNLILEEGEEYRLTEEGRKSIRVVFTGGAFDIIHPGHLFTLSSAKKLGDVLVVVVATDKTVVKSKGRSPINGQEQRLELVRSLKIVDVAILGSEGDVFETVEKVKPDVIALGYDQRHDEDVLVKEGQRRGFSFKVVRLGSPVPSIKSSEIIKNRREVTEEL